MKYSKLDKFERRVVVVVSTVGGIWGFFTIRKFIKDEEERKELKKRKELFEASGAGEINLASKAGQIYDAFYNYWGGMYEDEERAIQVLQSVPYEYIEGLGITYNALYHKILNEDFIKYLEPEQYQRVEYLFS